MIWTKAPRRKFVTALEMQTVGIDMTENGKTWIVEAGDVLDIMPHDKKQPATIRVNKRYQDPLQPAPAAHASPAPKRRIKPAPAAKSKLHFAQLLALTYLIGPLAILLTPRGRQQKPIVAMAGLAVLSTAALIAMRFGGLVRESQPGSVWIWGGLLTVAVIGGFTAWARALHLVGREGVPHLNKMPHWLRQGWAISGLGLIAPGSGMLLSGRADRAAITLWLMGPVVLAIAILLNAMGLWQHHLASGWLAAAGPALEAVFMVAVGLVALGFLVYVAQALEGMRQVLVEPGLKTRVKGDYYAMAVLASVVVMVVVANPVRMAHQLDLGGDILREQGFQAIPLQLTLAASHLDPAKPEYSMQAMDLYVALGDYEKADSLRADLDQNLSAYVAMVQRETVAEFGLAQANVRPKIRPRPAAVRSAYTRPGAVSATATSVVATGSEQLEAAPSDKAIGVDTSVLMGLMESQDKPAVAVADSVTVARKHSVTRAMGLPFGFSLPASESDSSRPNR